MQNEKKRLHELQANKGSTFEATATMLTQKLKRLSHSDQLQ
jgi:DNA-binding HxlR family transcriptional regulator